MKSALGIILAAIDLILYASYGFGAAALAVLGQAIAFLVVLFLLAEEQEKINRVQREFQDEKG